jgi:peroxiredoxin
MVSDWQVVCRWQSCPLLTTVTSLTTGVCPWKHWYLTGNRCLLLTTVVHRWQQVFVTDNSCLSLAIGISYLTDNKCNRCLLLTTVIPHWQQVHVTDNSDPSLTTGVCYWQQWSLTDNRCLLLTTVIPRWQQVSLSDNTGSLYHRKQVSVTDNSDPSQTTGVCYWQVVCRWQQVSVTVNRGISLTTGVSYRQRWCLTDNRCLLLTTTESHWQQRSVIGNSVLVYYINVDTV